MPISDIPSNPRPRHRAWAFTNTGFGLIVIATSAVALAQQTGSTQPATDSGTDPAMQWIFSEAPRPVQTQSPGTQPAGTTPAGTTPAESTSADDAGFDPSPAGNSSEQPPASSPFAKRASATARPARIHLSDGTVLLGQLDTTPGKPIRLWDESAKVYRDIPFGLIHSIQAQVTWERLQEEWHFAASGSDVKEFTGKTYPARELQYTLTLVNGQKITGGVVAPLYYSTESARKTLTLNKRDKGQVGQSLDQLIYVHSVEFDPDLTTQPAGTQPADTQPTGMQPASPLPATTQASQE